MQMPTYQKKKCLSHVSLLCYALQKEKLVLSSKNSRTSVLVEIQVMETMLIVSDRF